MMDLLVHGMVDNHLSQHPFVTQPKNCNSKTTLKLNANDELNIDNSSTPLELQGGRTLTKKIHL